MNESIDLESNESANYSDDDSNDYQLNTNKKDYESINKISDDSDNEKPMETQLHGSYSVSANSRQRIKYQLDKIKRTKKMIHKKMESLDNNEKVKHISKIEKDKMILSAIQNATREEAVSTILSKLQKIEQFSDSVDYISSSAEELENFIYNRCGKIVNKKYSEMARDVYANLNTLRISKIVCQLIINDQIGLKKLLCKPDKFLEKCKHLEQKFSRLIKPNSKIEVHNTCTDTLKVELKDDMNIQFDKIREENMKQLSNWMEKEKIDRQSCKSKLKQHMSENIQCKENEKQVKCMLSNDDYLTNKEESTKSDVDCEEGTYESKSSTETKPQELKLIKRVSPLKHKIKEIKENTMKQKSEKKLDKLIIKGPNTASLGSLLKLCDLKLMHTYGYGSAKVSLYSTNDIKILQLLSPFPSKLNLNGRAFMSEIVQYIFDNTGKFKMITGWIEHVNTIENEKSSSRLSYNYLWKLLSPERKCGVFEVYKGLKLYVIPMDIHNKAFFRTLGLKMFHVDNNSLEEQIYPAESSTTHYFAYVGFIKRFEQYNGYLNPEIIFDIKEDEDKSNLSQSKNQEIDNNADVDFVLDLIIDFESGVVPVEDLMIRLQNKLSQERINRSLSKLDKEIRDKFELLLTKIVEFKQGSTIEAKI